MAKEKAEVAPTPPPPPAPPSGPWVSAARGDLWTDGHGKDHKVIGVVHEGFDSNCDGVDECWRLYTHATRIETDGNGKETVVHFRQPLAQSVVDSVSAWKKRGA